MPQRAQIWLLCLMAAGLIFALDINVPSDVAMAVSYVAVVFLSAMSPRRRDVLYIAGIITALVILAAPMEPRGSAIIYAISNRGLSMFAIWTTAVALYFLRRSQQDLATLNLALEQRVQQRAEEAQRRAADLAIANAQLENEMAQRQKAEVEVRNSQAMYASLVEDLPIPVIRKDCDGKFVFANRAFCSWVGTPPERIVGQTDFELFPAAMAQKYHDDDQSVLTTGELFLDVERNEHSGKVNWVHVIKTPARDGSNRIVGTQAIFWDVTARRVAEDRLRDSEALYHSLVDTLPLCLIRKDEDGVFTFVNSAFCEYFNAPAADFIGKTDFDIFSYEVAQKYREGDIHVMTTGETIEKIEAIRLADQRQRKIQVFKSAVRDARGDVVGVQIIFRDVTDELAIADALRESQQRLQAILDNTTAVIYLKDIAGHYLLVNREFEKLFGLNHSDIVGRTDHDVFPSTFADLFRANDQQVMATGETLVAEEVAPHDDGPHTYVSSKFPLRNAAGEVFAVAGISTDITERRRAEEQLQLYASKLESTNRELEEFAYIVSHDLQEPLRSLSFFSDSLQQNLGDDLPEQSRQDLAFITSAADRMQRLVRDLLALSRTGRADLKCEKVKLNECVAAALDALSTRLKESQAVVEVGELPEVNGDRTLLTQLFQNLIGNALKFVSKQTPHVQVSAHEADNAWVIEVRDNGIGIKPEYAQKIFAPFQRLHARAEYEGTGIGLAICRKVVQRHGGTIWVDSQPGEGASFKFQLPLEGGEN